MHPAGSKEGHILLHHIDGDLMPVLMAYLPFAALSSWHDLEAWRRGVALSSVPRRWQDPAFPRRVPSPSHRLKTSWPVSHCRSQCQHLPILVQALRPTRDRIVPGAGRCEHPLNTRYRFRGRRLHQADELSPRGPSLWTMTYHDQVGQCRR